MSDLRQAAQAALEALYSVHGEYLAENEDEVKERIDFKVVMDDLRSALRSALAATEPAAHVERSIPAGYCGKIEAHVALPEGTPLYPAPPQAQQPCPCGDRPANECDEEWGPKCDLGNNEKHVRVHQPQAQQPDTYERAHQQIVGRYRVEKRNGGGFWPYCVKAGSGTMELFIGHKTKCDEVAQALQTACLDGAYMASKAQAQQPVPDGWRIARNSDGSVGIWAPPPRPGESQRTSEAVYPEPSGLHALLGKLADHMARGQPQPVPPLLSDDKLDEMRQADNGGLNFVTLREFRLIARAVEREVRKQFIKEGEA